MGRSFYGDNGGYYKAAGCAEDSHLCLFERSDDYCSVAYWYQELPTNPFRNCQTGKREWKVFENDAH